ncbi:MAG: PilZ domain-containing protein [Candidatus Hinthialibacter antarcticus]|nr:PilZ domain-containing protein [Candidatus Hinthialibacter antarcticus]
MNERRIFEREEIRIPFIYSFDEGESLHSGEWFEAITLDIGPVLVGGLAFHCEQPCEMGKNIRLSLFMDMELMNTWKDNPEEHPPIYHGKICRITDDDGKQKLAVAFKGMEELDLGAGAMGGTE